MLYLILALVVSVVGVMPLLIAGKQGWAIGLGIPSTLVLWFFYWTEAPAMMGLFMGPAILTALCLWTVCAIVDAFKEEEFTRACTIALVGWLFFFGALIANSSMFNASTYANMIGQVEERNWTADVQPKDPRHMVMVSSSTADFLAAKAVAQGGSIGSQFQLDTEHVRLQKVRGELVYVYPLDFRGYSTWTGSSAVPAYIIVYAEDQERVPHLVELPQGKGMVYTPGAYFGSYLRRHLRNNGFLMDGLADLHLELDEEGTPYWVVTTYQYATSLFGTKLTGVATVNPTTGEIKRYALNDVPSWIDRVYPRSTIKEYLEDRGELASGWLNSFWSKLNITKPENPLLVYGEEDKSEFVTSITSHNDKDDSLLGLMYTDTRNGRTVYYKVNGGATDSAILKAVNSNSQVKYLHLSATTPQIYNVYGTMAAVVPLVNDTGAYQAVAMVSVLNIQDVAVGTTQNAALQNFQALLSRHGQQIALEKHAVLQKLTGVIDRIVQDVGTNGSSYLFHVAGVPRIFVGSSQDHLKLPLTQIGDIVEVSYLASGEERVSIAAFDNTSFSLDKTAMKGEVERAAQAHKSYDENFKTVADLTNRLRDLPPEKLKQIQELLKQ